MHGIPTTVVIVWILVSLIAHEYQAVDAVPYFNGTPMTETISAPLSAVAASSLTSAHPALNKNNFSAIQFDIIKAVQNEDYDLAASLASSARQEQEFNRVIHDVLGNGDPPEDASPAHRSDARSNGTQPNPRRIAIKKSFVMIDALFSSFTNILVSELGDKTFIVAAIMAGLYPRELVLAGALSALALMTVLSVAAGFALPMLLPRKYTHYASVVLFGVTGIKLLYHAREMRRGAPSGALHEMEEQVYAVGRQRWWVVSPVILQAFVQTFLAEWGDRSQIATIALAAHKDAVWVMVGSVAGHAVCTLLAVIGGRIVASRISEKSVATAGGLVFIIIAAHSLRQGDSALINS